MSERARGTMDRIDGMGVLRTLRPRATNPTFPGSTPEHQLEEWRTAHRSEPAVREWLASAGVGARLAEAAIDVDLIPARAAEWLGTAGQGGSLVLAGPVGSGKTLTAVWLLRELYADGEQHNPKLNPPAWSWMPFSAFYVKARELYRAVFERDEPTLRRARESRVLVVDEWGGAYESAWPLAEMDGLVDDRWENRRATIVTTNAHPDQGSDSLKATAPRAYDRLCDDPGPGVVLLDRASLRGAVSAAAKGAV